MTTRRYLSLADAADLVSLSQRTVRRLIAEGELPGYHVGGKRRASVRIAEADLHALMRRIPSA